MNIYHPAFDTYHAAFRLLLLSTRVDFEEAECHRIQLWDYYYLFPYQITKMRFPRELYHFKQLFDFAENPYNSVLDGHNLFARMEPFQRAAMNYLVSVDLIERESLANCIFQRTQKPIPAELNSLFFNLDAIHENVIELFRSEMGSMALNGQNGFKDRTHLLEFRYDL